MKAFGGNLTGGVTWELFVEGDLKAGTPGKIFEYGADGTPEKFNKDVFQIAKIRVSAEGADRVFLQLANPIDIPAGLIKADKSGFRSESELNGELAAAVNAARTSLVRQCVASLQEVERRFQVVEITATGAVFLGVTSPFGSGSAFAGGSIKLRLFDELQLEQNPAQIKFSGRCEVAGTAHFSIGAVSRLAALVCILEMDGGASVRVDVDDFNISLPEFDLPSLHLPSIHNPLKLKGGLKGLAGAFQRLVNKVEATKIEASFEQDPAPAPGEEARLALRVRPAAVGGIDWAVVAYDFADGDWADSQIDAKLAKFKAVIKQAGATTVATVDAMRFASTATKTVFEGTITVRDPLTVKDDKSRFGPLEVSWEGLVVVPSVSTGAQSLLVDVSFRRLLVRVHDDPSAFLAFSGKLQLSPKGIHVDELHLVEPYPIELIAKATAAAAREAASIVKVIFSLVETAAKQAEEIIVILGKMAAAVARAAVFVAGEIVESVAELVSKALSGIAELLAAALRELRRLGENAPHFVVEIRIATDPIELRQILITLPAPSSSKPIAGGALGVEVAVEAGWQPGLLIDFVSQPGAYLTLTHDVSTSGSPLKAATVSTDLWLKRGASGASTTTPVRDADGDKGDRADKPLLGLDLLLLNSADADDLMLVVAGLNRGNPVFLQWLDGKSAPLPLPVPPSDIKAKTAPGAFVFKPIKDKFDVAVQFDKKRILPLLGMGEPGKEKSSGPSFLDKLQNSLSNVIWVKDTKTKASIAERLAEVDLILGLKAAGVETEVTLQAKLSLDNFDVTVEAGKLFPIVSQRIEEHALGLVWVIEQKDKDERLANKPVEMFRLGFAGGQSGFELNATKARMELRFDGLSSDGKGVVFDVETFKISAGGLDLKAKVRDAAVQMNGIDVPFRFTAGSLEIKAGRLVSASIAGRGSLPPKLIGDADCTVALTFGQDASEGIVLQSGKVELDKKGDPIVCHASRFTLTITDLDIAFVKDNGYHFYYLVTGSLRFTPKSGEFESGLLQFLDGVEMNLERTPLSADPRVLIKHISFQKALNPKKTFNLFNLFTFEIRGFGYHPASPKFGGDPAVNVSGQIKFVEIGDVMQPKIDFHGLWIAPPAKGQSLPRIRADGLGIELNLKGSIHIRGAVLAVDPGTTVEGTELAPPGYNTYGFLGEGELAIPGWGDLAASLGFLELERQDQPGERRKSFFFYAEMRKLAIEIPAVVWTFYLREVGFGFGFRYTLEALAAADRAPSIPKLISSLDEISKRQGDLHKFSAWRPEVEGDHVTLALKGAIQAYPAETSWDDEAEEAAENPFLFDLVAAIRSDFTLFMGLRGWLGTNYIDYLNDKDGLRSNPGLRGYLYISAPHKRLLARAIGDSKGYIGDRIPALAKTGGSEPPLRKALRSIDWSVTLFIKPGLFHYEMGWPDQLVVRLMDAPNMRVTVRGGMIFRAADDGLLWGYNIEADAFFRFGGSLQIGPVGVAGEASLDAHLVARVICYLTWRIKGSMVYGLIALDASLAISIRAWLEVDLGFTSFTIRISFSRSLQLSASVEMVISTEGVGAQVHARVAISAFGCTLSVSIGFTLGASQLAEARARVQRFMAMSITADEPDAAPAVTSHTGDKRIESDAKNAEAPAMAPAPEQVVKPNPDTKLKPSQFRAQFGSAIKATDFWLVLHQAGSGDDCYALLVPREPEDPEKSGKPEKSGFYAAPTFFKAKSGERREDQPAYHLVIPDGWVGPDIKRWDGVSEQPVAVDAAHADITVGWSRPVQTEQPGGTQVFQLAHLFDECFLTDTAWKADEDPTKPPYRTTLAPWCEPPVRRHKKAEANGGATGQERIAERDTVQRDRAASAAENPIVEAVHQARSTTLSMFLEQFVGLAETGLRKETYAHVSHLGLVFRGKATDLERLAELTIEKLEIDTEGATVPVHKAGTITVFNGKKTWFEQQDPVLASGRSAVAADGIKLDWKLQLAWAGKDADKDNDKDKDPEHFLHHYEIRRTIEGLEFTPRIVKVKPAATIGGRDEHGNVTLMLPDWQFSDDLADISADLRAALLPARDETLALQAAINWATVFGDNDTVSVTYTVTPVDIAGTRGLPKSFLVDVDKPQPPIRPAEAELRFVVTAMGQGDKPDPWTSDQPPIGSLSAVIALRDPFRPRDPDDPKDSKRDFVPDNPAIRVLRNYRLIADPESIRPSGHYGTDGLTDRRLGPPSGVGPTADELVWILNYREKDLPDNSATPPFKEGKRLFVDMRNKDGKIPSVTKIDALEPDHDTVAKFPLWRRLDGVTKVGTVDDVLFQAPPVRKQQPADDDTDPEGTGPKDNFLKSLWRRENQGKERIATRFSLETFHTVMDYTDPKNPKHLATFNSKRTPVAVEVRVEHFPRNATPAPEDIGLLRPEAFEWPVHLEMPAHQPGQVRAESGFARFRVPPADVTGALGSLTSDTPTPPTLVRDAERRVLTQISFAASSQFGTDSATGIDQIHQTAVAGYDVHELDFDDLARLDTSKDVAIDSNATTWRRSRRVARVERVSPEMAQLMPDHNRDWQGWEAHYPSETWRLVNRTQGRAGQSQPVRAPWYSAAESTLHFAERVPRIRLFPTAPEGAVTDLMRNGRPMTLRARFVAAANSRAEKTLLSIAPSVDMALIGCEWQWVALAGGMGAQGRLVFYPGVGSCEVRLADGDFRFSPQLVREALLGFGWTASKAVVEKFSKDRAALDGLAIELSGQTVVSGTVIETGKTIEPLSFNSFRHPLLEEVIGELEYSYSVATTTLYRRYVVTPQSVKSSDVKDFAGFLSATVAEKDPYGWAALQQLGLAVTLRLYDRDQDRFVLPKELLALIDPVMRAASQRYRDTFGQENIGQPFVDVLLKPGSDRVAGPFNAVLRTSSVEDEKQVLNLNDDGLALAQLSLRPRPARFWKYYLAEMAWTKADWPSARIAAGNPKSEPDSWRTISIAGYDLYFVNEAGKPTFEVLRSVDGSFVEVRPPVSAPQDGSMDPVPASLQAITWPKSRTLSSELDPNLSLFFRVAGEEVIDLGKVLKLRARIVTSTLKKGSKAVETNETQVLFADLKQAIIKAQSDFDGDPADLAGFPSMPFADGGDLAPVLVELESPAAFPGKVTRRSPFELFEEIKADIWAAQAAERDKADEGVPEATDASVKAFASLWQNLRSALPDFAWPAQRGDGQLDTPTYADYQQVMGAYLSWSQRFLDHGATAGEAPKLPYALAAPIKAQPWHLAADSAGWVTLSFLHADRWAHSRAYAVRPTPRYQNLALGAGYYSYNAEVDQQDSERLVTKGVLGTTLKDIERFKKPIGYALAVSPRTERIEPPVILSSRLMPDKAGDARQIWELVVARHGEEGLAFSNRSLFARLGSEGTALTFAREYRDRNWPSRLTFASGTDKLPDAELYPTRYVGPLGRPVRDSEIDGKMLGDIAMVYPSLWKGADIWRIDQLPPHYRVTALAVARAGLVVSNVVSAVQDDTPRRKLQGRESEELLDSPAIKIERDKNADGSGKIATIRLTGLRLVAHADLTVEGAWPWIATDPDPEQARKDIVWWPDPNVTYTLLRHGTATAEPPPDQKPSLMEEEDAVVQLVARPDAQAEQEATPVPIVVRCRGPRYEPKQEVPLQPGQEPTPAQVPGWPAVTTTEIQKVFGSGSSKAGREFRLSFALEPRANGLIKEQTARYAPKDPPDDSVRDEFNKAAEGFAKIRAERQLTLVVKFDGVHDVDAVKQHFADAASALATAADSLDTTDKDNVVVANALRGMAANLTAEANAIASTAPLPDLTRWHLPRNAVVALVTSKADGEILTPIDSAAMSLAMSRTNAEVLTVFDVPTEEEADAVLALDKHPFGKRGGALWRLCRERLLGAADGFRIRAVDRRNAIDMPQQKPSSAGSTDAWSAVGEIDTDVTPPRWTGFASEG
jgi:hypothetical protein